MMENKHKSFTNFSTFSEIKGKNDNWNFSRTCRNCFKEQQLSVHWKNVKTVKRYSNWYYICPTVCNSIHGWPEEIILQEIELKPRIWWRHIDDIFFIETLNAFRPTIKFTAEWSRGEINILDVNVRLRNRQLGADLHVKPTTLISFLTQHLAIHTTVRKVYPIARLWDITGFVLIIKSLINVETNDRNGWWKEAIVKGWLGRRDSKHEVNLGIAILNEGILELLRVNLLLTSLTTQCFRMSEAYCRNFKLC